MKKYDVLVIGGGLSAVVAAKTASDNGKKVGMLFPNGGFSEMLSGAVDVAGVIPGEKLEIYKDYSEAVNVLAKDNNHPYNICKDHLKDGLNTLKKLDNYSYSEKNVWVENTLGTFTLTTALPFYLKEVKEKENVLVIGFRGNINFNAKVAAENYNYNQKRVELSNTYYSTEIDLPSLNQRHKLSDGELADFLDTEAGIEELVNILSTYNVHKLYDKFLFAPVLGFYKTETLMNKIKEVCGVEVGEVVANNSVLGYRYMRRLYKALDVDMMQGYKATAIKEEDGVVKVTAEAGLTDQIHKGEEVVLEADKVIVATGSYVGGGLQRRKKELWINLFEEELPYIKEEQVEYEFLSAKGNDFFKVGANVDNDLHYKNYKNVFVCGSLLAGANRVKERSRGGIDVASAYLAGSNASK